MTYRPLESLSIEELRYRERDVVLKYMKDHESQQNIDDVRAIVSELRRRGMGMKDPNNPKIYP